MPKLNPLVDPHAIIVEQPSSVPIRFRYVCEGRSAGTIPGVNSRNDKKTYPCIRIVNYVGPVVIIVSCVSDTKPHRAHPNNLVGKDCKDGVASVRLNVGPGADTYEFSSAGIQCVKKTNIGESIEKRRVKNVDPFKAGFGSAKYDLGCVRLAFQVVLRIAKPDGNIQNVPLMPLLTDPIFDKKTSNDLVIFDTSDCFGSTAGGKKLMLLCEKVVKEDVAIRFVERHGDEERWSALVYVKPSQVHRRTAIVFHTPAYQVTSLDYPVDVGIELYRPSDGSSSAPMPFTYTPHVSDCSAALSTKRKRQNVQMSQELRDYLTDHPPQVSNSLDQQTSGRQRKNASYPLNIPLDIHDDYVAMQSNVELQSLAPNSTPSSVGSTPSPPSACGRVSAANQMLAANRVPPMCHSVQSNCTTNSFGGFEHPELAGRRAAEAAASLSNTQIYSIHSVQRTPPQQQQQQPNTKPQLIKPSYHPNQAVHYQQQPPQSSHLEPQPQYANTYQHSAASTNCPTNTNQYNSINNQLGQTQKPFLQQHPPQPCPGSYQPNQPVGNNHSTQYNIAQNQPTSMQIMPNQQRQYANTNANQQHTNNQLPKHHYHHQPTMIQPHKAQQSLLNFEPPQQNYNYTSNNNQMMQQPQQQHPSNYPPTPNQPSYIPLIQTPVSAALTLNQQPPTNNEQMTVSAQQQQKGDQQQSQSLLDDNLSDMTDSFSSLSVEL